MPKRRCGERDGGGKKAKPRQKHHLYLLFDDWESGYSIRKIKFPLPSDDSGEGVDEQRGEQLLPPVAQRLPVAWWRLVAPRELPQYFTSAFGAMIVPLHYTDGSSAVQMIDVHARSILPGTRSNCPVNPIYFPVGSDKLFALDARVIEVCCLLPPKQNDSESDGDDDSLMDESYAEYVSESDYASNSKGKWRWQQLAVTPFSMMDISSYAMLHDGQTILICTNSDYPGHPPAATFTFDTGKAVWNRLGEWALPFTGRGCFDPDLRALVGLSKGQGDLGYIYACNVPRSDGWVPAWKRSKEKVFGKNPAETHVSASLIYMGHRSKFCLVECVCVKEDNADQVRVKEHNPDQVTEPEGVGGVPELSHYMYRLMTFSLKIDTMDVLRIKHSRVKYYKVPNKTSTEFIHEGPVAFWL